MFTDMPIAPFTVECTRGIADMKAVRSAWLRLVETASEPNVFFEPAVLLPALAHLCSDTSVRCVLVWGQPRDRAQATTPDNPGRVLCGLFPVHDDTGAGARTGIWVHKYAYCGAPLVRADCVPHVLKAFLDWQADEGSNSFRWPQLPVASTLYKSLLQQLQQRRQPTYVQHNFLRAEFKPAGDTDTYLRRALSTSTRKELLRMERRLQEQGEVSVRELAADDDAQPWIADFLRLEASGWKGDTTTALDSAPASRSFFSEMALAAHATGQLIMLQLRVDDSLVAMNVGLRTADGGFYFKIAHTPAFRRYMPGRILELGFIRWLHTHSDVHWFDSCAAPNHQMIERLWDGRRHMQSLWTGRDNRIGRLKVTLFALLNEMKKFIRAGSTNGDTDV